MSNLPQHNTGKRRISNLPPNQTADHTIDNNDNNRDVQMTIKNGPDYQIKVNNLEESPAPLSREPIISTPNPNQAPQSIINNQYTNNPNQFQQVPIVNPSLVANQMYPQNPNVIIVRQIAPTPFMIYNDRYTPSSLTCPYCMKKVTSVPSTYWSCKSCEICFCLMWAYFATFGLCIFLDLCCLSCRDGDYCCYEADHRCPYCNNIIAKRAIGRRMCD